MNRQGKNEECLQDKEKFRCIKTRLLSLISACLSNYFVKCPASSDIRYPKFDPTQRSASSTSAELSSPGHGRLAPPLQPIMTPRVEVRARVKNRAKVKQQVRKVWRRTWVMMGTWAWAPQVGTLFQCEVIRGGSKFALWSFMTISLDYFLQPKYAFDGHEISISSALPFLNFPLIDLSFLKKVIIITFYLRNSNSP